MMKVERNLKLELLEVNKSIIEKEEQEQRDGSTPGLTRSIRDLKSRRREIVRRLVELERRKEEGGKNNGR